MSRLKQAIPSAAVIALVIGAWWALVRATGSVIFPTPWQVATGPVELIEDGTLEGGGFDSGGEEAGSPLWVLSGAGKRIAPGSRPLKRPSCSSGFASEAARRNPRPAARRVPVSSGAGSQP